MLGFAWMLRNEAARAVSLLLEPPIDTPLFCSRPVWGVVYGAIDHLGISREGSMVMWSRADKAAALALLTAHNAEECLRRRRHMEVLIMDDVTSTGSVTPEMQEKIKQWYTTLVDSSTPSKLTKGEAE